MRGAPSTRFGLNTGIADGGGRRQGSAIGSIMAPSGGPNCLLQAIEFFYHNV